MLGKFARRQRVRDGRSRAYIAAVRRWAFEGPLYCTERSYICFANWASSIGI
jgi:hypothetical protein